jgi:hypothetical protein
VSSAEIKRRIASAVSIGRLVRAEDVASVVAFLASPKERCDKPVMRSPLVAERSANLLLSAAARQRQRHRQVCDDLPRVMHRPARRPPSQRDGKARVQASGPQCPGHQARPQSGESPRLDLRSMEREAPVDVQRLACDEVAGGRDQKAQRAYEIRWRLDALERCRLRHHKPICARNRRALNLGLG